MSANPVTRRSICWRLRGLTFLAVVLFVVLLSVVFRAKFRRTNTPSAQASAAQADEPLPPVHPIFGTAQKTIGVDINVQRPVQATGLKGLLDDTFGRRAPYIPPPPAIRRNLIVDQTEMQWSGGGYRYGYLYLCAPSSIRPLWEFAPCPKANLREVTSQDLSA